MYVRDLILVVAGSHILEKSILIRLHLHLASRIKTEFRPDPARKLSAKLYDIHHCCVYSEKLLMMDRGTVLNM